TNSMWPDTFGLACCAIEMMSIVSSRYDIARFGMEPFRGSPRQADLLIVSGRVSNKMAAPLRQIYDQMLEPKWVIAMGACASSGGMFNNYAVVQSVDKIVAVDVYVPACTRPSGRASRRRTSSGAWRAERVRHAARLRGDSRGAPRDDDRRGRRRARRRGDRPARRPRLQLPLRHHGRRLPRLGRRRRLRLHRHAHRARPQLADDAGLPGGAAREAEAVRGQLPPALDLGAPAPRPAAGVGGRGRAGTDPDPGVADRRLARARGLGPDGHRDRGAPEHEAAAPRRRLGRPPAPQGLPRGRRAGPVLGRGMTTTAPRSLTSRQPIYEGSRVPSPIPTVLRTSQELLDTGDVMTVNFGPNHPSTHGVLRLVVDLYGEDVTGLEAVIGYLHTGFEKTMEQKTWWKCITYPERIDYV